MLSLMDQVAKALLAAIGAQQGAATQAYAQIQQRRL